MKLEDESRRGERARQLLKDPMIQEFLKDLRENVYINIRTSHYKDVDEREDLYKMLKVMDKFEEIFERHIRTGKLAQSKLDQLKTKVDSTVRRLKSI